MNARILAAVAGFAALAGCTVPNDASVRVFGMCYPPDPNESGVCAYPTSCASLFLGNVEGDVASDSIDGPLIWPVQVDNQRSANPNSSGSLDTAMAWIEGYRIHYAFSPLAGVKSIPDVDVPISRHPVRAAGSTVVIAPVVPAAVGTYLYGNMADSDLLNFEAELKAYGHYGDGDKFETGPFKIVGRLGRNNIPQPVNSGTSGSPACAGLDPSKPIYVASCPQSRQSSVMLCIAAPTN
jgi:hypothetical protein